MATPATISRTTELSDSQYKWGFVTDVETDIAPKGISEDIVRLISAKKDEPEWLLEWRLKSLAHWFKMAESVVANAPQVVGFDPFLRLVDYLLVRAGLTDLVGV